MISLSCLPFSPSLISLMVSVDVKHHVHFLFYMLYSVQFTMVSLRLEKPICALSRLSDACPTLPLRRSSNVRLTDDGLVSSFEGRSSSASSFRASLLRAIDGVMSLASCSQVVSQASQHFRSSEKQATCDGCFAASLCARSFPFTPACREMTEQRDWRAKQPSQVACFVEDLKC